VTDVFVCPDPEAAWIQDQREQELQPASVLFCLRDNNCHAGEGA
jgi:hypothetical protein